MEINFYTQIHKAIRRKLFLFSMQAATTDFTDHADCEIIQIELKKLSQFLSIHAEHENKFFHPFIEKIIANGVKKLTSEHHEQEISIQNLKMYINEILLSNNPLRRNQLGLIFYNQLNSFIANYLTHLNDEEAIVPILNDRCTEAELMQPINALLLSFTAQEVMESISYMLPALTFQERVDMMQAMLSHAPREDVQAMTIAAANALELDDWSKLKNALDALN